MGLEIRTARLDEYESLIDTVTTAFLERPDLARAAAEMATVWEPERTWAAFDGARPVGTFRSWGTEITVPGSARLPAAAVSAVTVLPTHRRRGVLTSMAAAEHAAIRERGETIGILYASEHPIYGRFGYGPATRNATWIVDTGRARMRADRPAASGVELARATAERIPDLRGAFERMRVAAQGEIRRRELTWAYRLGLTEPGWGDPWKGFLALRRDTAGEVDGYVRYTAKEEWVHGVARYAITVQELVAATGEAYDALWRFLLELDLVATVTIEDAREHERLPWLLVDARAARAEDPGEALWVRLFDVPQALEARTYERADRLVIEVLDEPAHGGRQRLMLDAGPDGARCRPTTAAADLVLPVAALGAAYLGGTRLSHAVLETGVDEPTPGALRRAEILLHTAVEPFCSTFF